MTTKLTFEEWKKLNLDSVKLSEEAKADSLIMNDIDIVKEINEAVEQEYRFQYEQYLLNDEQRYTDEEIRKMFQDDDTINEEFKMLYLARTNALAQAMYNCVHKKSVMTCTNPYGDTWVEEHNRFVQDYQRYHNT